MSAPGPLVAIVGKPNAGKSTLFNALTGRSAAITSPVAGTTRDWLEGSLKRSENSTRLADTCGFGTTGEMGELMDSSVKSLLPRCSAVLMVVNPGGLPEEREINLARFVLRSGLPVVVTCNKCDSERDDPQAWPYLRLGLGSPVPVSAAKPRNLAELTVRLEAAAALGKAPGETGKEGPVTASCVVLGQPNTGKSTLFNALLASQRSLVHNEPGTTRDPVRARAEIAGLTWELVDTAGVTRRVGSTDAIYRDAQQRSLKALQGADVAILLFDLTIPLARQDLRLADAAFERGTALAVALNKADLLEREQVREVEAKAAEYLHGRFPLLGRFPVLITSAKNGEGVPELGAAVAELNRLRHISVPDSVLAGISHSWPTPGRTWTVRQASTAPPVFMASPPPGIRPSSRFVINRVRDALGMHGVPLAVRWKYARNGRGK